MISLFQLFQMTKLAEWVFGLGLFVSTWYLIFTRKIESSFSDRLGLQFKHYLYRQIISFQSGSKSVVYLVISSLDTSDPLNMRWLYTCQSVLANQIKVKFYLLQSFWLLLLELFSFQSWYAVFLLSTIVQRPLLSSENKLNKPEKI